MESKPTARRLRPILPAFEARPEPAATEPPGRRNVTAACGACRKRKTKVPYLGNETTWTVVPLLIIGSAMECGQRAVRVSRNM